MRAAGIREARQSLSALLEDVRNGHEIVITDRGKPVARLVPPQPLSAKAFTGRGELRRSMSVLRPPLSRDLMREPGSLVPGNRRARARGKVGEIRGPVYLDASALAKLYLPEPESLALDRALRGRRDLTVSDLAVTELLAALAERRLATTGADPAPGARSALLLDLDSGMYRRAEIAPATHRAAERLLATARPPLRSADALHLALAMTAGVATFLSYDAHRAEAARGLGLIAFP
jgi:prevent-host-death family protein